MTDESDAQIWSEFFRFKNRLMDYDENLRDAISNARMIRKLGLPETRNRVHYAKAQKHVGLVLDLGLASGAIPPDFDKDKLAFARDVAKGKWSKVEDFEECQQTFLAAYQQTKFYNVTVAKDNRPAVVRKYGKASGAY